MSNEDGSRVDRYLAEALGLDDEPLVAALARNREAGLPPIDVSPAQGKLLMLLAQMMGAKRILEIGTLGGYSTIWLARALPEGGRVVSLEISPHHAEVARANLRHAGLEDRVEVRVGAAAESLAALVAESAGPFDLFFIDADKPSGPHYVDRALELSRSGSVIVVDNVIRRGAVADAESTDPNVRGSREVLAKMGAHPRLSATAIQTVGLKGWDGLAIGRVVA
jgi:predicted O-methyltransferase YrrM